VSAFPHHRVERAPASSDADERPLAEYAGLVGAFIASFGGIFVAAAASGRVPARISFVDIGLLGMASHKVSRLIAKDEVTSFARAPFVRVRRENGETKERPRTGEGIRHAVGELISCPHCVGQWVSAAFVVGFVWAPRPTRSIASAFAVNTVSDFLHVAYRHAQE
jgi:hypothetical protein